MRITRLRSGKNARRLHFWGWNFLSDFLGTARTSITPSKYAIELRDRGFRLKRRLERRVTSVQWEWNRIGGCGRCTLVVDGDADLVNVSVDDDIRIYLPDEGGTSATLWYRGYVENVSSRMGSGGESINIECMGYFGFLERLIVHNSGAPKAYSSTEISAIVTDIMNSFVVPNSSITLGTVDASAFTPDSLSFKDTVKNSLDTLFDFLGTVQYGVDANLNFFWYNATNARPYPLYLGDKVVQFDDRIIYREIINDIQFEGGKDGVNTYVSTGSSSDSQNRYAKRQAILSNGSINTDLAAAQYIKGILKQRGKPRRSTTVQLHASKKRWEASLPIGPVAVIDPETNQTGAVYGTVAAGGSGKLYGTIAAGGSGQLYGGSRRDSLDRIQYTLDPRDGRVNATMQLGESSDLSRTSASLKRLELSFDTLRQRSL